MQQHPRSGHPVSYEHIHAALQSQPLFENKSWRLSPEPWWLSPEQVDEIRRIGQACLEFYRALDALYRRCSEDRNLLRNRELKAHWVADYLDRGKPFRIIEHGRWNRSKRETPVVIRPDLLWVDDGWALTEMDSVPGGVGLTAFLGGIYASAGCPVLADSEKMVTEFYNTVSRITTEQSDPMIAIVVSDEASTYRPEFEFIARTLRSKGKQVYVCHPDEILAMGGELSIPINGNPRRIHVIYRFWELFDIGNISTAQAIFEAVEAGEVALTPPMKAYQEEKLNLALLHHHVLEPYWRENLPKATYTLLKKIVPKSWVMDPVQLPPNAVLDAPHVGGRPIREWEELGEASQKERNLIIKASGFHESAWGARSVILGSDHSREEWLDAIGNATDMAEETLHILQEYRKPKRLQHPVYTEDGSGIRIQDGRLRLCPFFFVDGDSANLSGILATFCPADKKIIHGMKDAAMLPCAVSAPPAPPQVKTS